LDALPISDPRWSEFVSACPAAHPFHHPAWAALIAEAHGLEGSGLARLAADGSVEAGLPVLELSRLGRRRWVALPYTDFCPPLARAGPVPDGLAVELDALRRESNVRELAVRAKLPGDEAVVTRRSIAHVLELGPDSDAVFKGLRSSFRTHVRKAERGGVLSFRWGAEPADLTEAFYRLHLDTRRRLGKPVQRRRFFELMWTHVMAIGFGRVGLVYAEGRPIAGAVFLTWNDTTVYLYGASDAASWKLQPNSLLFWRALQAASESGNRLFDFGRSNPENEGLRNFKRGWGADESELLYTALGAEPADEQSTEGRAQRVVESMIRRSPAPVARVIGELLYPLTA
jgi:CelD/BcsL family acetyltransferase involved in cellulose biosynthesis